MFNSVGIHLRSAINSMRGIAPTIPPVAILPPSAGGVIHTQNKSFYAGRGTLIGRTQKGGTVYSSYQNFYRDKDAFITKKTGQINTNYPEFYRKRTAEIPTRQGEIKTNYPNYYAPKTIEYKTGQGTIKTGYAAFHDKAGQTEIKTGQGTIKTKHPEYYGVK